MTYTVYDNSLLNPPTCNIHMRKMNLYMYDRPGSPPGNGWSCPDCMKGLGQHLENTRWGEDAEL